MPEASYRRKFTDALREWHSDLHLKTLIWGFAILIIGLFTMFFFTEYLGSGLSIAIIGAVVIAWAMYYRLMERTEGEIEENALRKLSFQKSFKLTDANRKKYLSLYRKDIKELMKNDDAEFFKLLKWGVAISLAVAALGVVKMLF